MFSSVSHFLVFLFGLYETNNLILLGGCPNVYSKVELKRNIPSIYACPHAFSIFLFFIFKESKLLRKKAFIYIYIYI